MSTGANEAFSRVLIDRALEFSGSNLLDSHQVRFELNGAKTMSHVTTINIEIRDLEALQAACAELGASFIENQTTYKWYGQQQIL
jgi:hypothetical protein